MAIISEDTRLTIATRLANLNYKEKLDALQEKLNESIEKRFISKTPDDVLTCYKQVDGAIYEIFNESPVE